MDRASNEFLKQAFDALTESICIINAKGTIIYVNASWIEFGSCNGLALTRSDWIGKNYLSACQSTDDIKSTESQICQGIQDVLFKDVDYFEYEYPCHSPTVKRWFTVTVKPMQFSEQRFAIISHHNITRRKLAEDEVMRLATTDSLTGALTRSAFDQQANDLWEQCHQQSQSLCIAMIDIDDFKLINDRFGHPFGDECLTFSGSLIKSIIGEEENICFARYGGEEFILLSTLPFKAMMELTESIRDAFERTKVPSQIFKKTPTVTVSIGLAELKIDDYKCICHAINVADSFLYEAKEEGKNCIIAKRCSGPLPPPKETIERITPFNKH